MEQKRTTTTIGEPRIDILPKETTEYFYTTILTRISEIIRSEHLGDESQSASSKSEEE